MQNLFPSRIAKKRNGSVLILVLGILIVIGLVTYFILPKLRPEIDPDTSELPPWKEWQLRQASEEEPKEIGDEQPKITEVLEYDVSVSLPESGESRGEIHVLISPTGDVGGAWYGHYYNSKKASCDIQEGGFEGKVFPGKIYQDESGEDASRLYFLTKGNFNFQETHFETGGLRIRVGDIYVNGWLSPDLSVAGEITLTSDEKYFQRFVWKSVRPLEK